MVGVLKPITEVYPSLHSHYTYRYSIDPYACQSFLFPRTVQPYVGSYLSPATRCSIDLPSESSVWPAIRFYILHSCLVRNLSNGAAVVIEWHFLYVSLSSGERGRILRLFLRKLSFSGTCNYVSIIDWSDRQPLINGYKYDQSMFMGSLYCSL